VAAPLKILFVAAECQPFAKTGGLGDVVSALPKALAARGHDVRVIMPLYRGLPWAELEVLPGVLVVPLGARTEYARLRRGRLPQSAVPVLFIEHLGFFDRDGIYGHDDDVLRFTFLSRAALIASEATGFVPDVVHASDWHTALVPVYLKTVMWGRPLGATASVYSIHNLAFQGVAPPQALVATGLGWEHYHPDELEHFGSLNLMKGAIRHADMLSTVSPTYAREIQTPAHGFGLDGEIRRRATDLVGIVNGIDEHEWDPATDPLLPAHFHRGDLGGKAANKAALRRHGGLEVEPGVPMFGMVARLTEQKGADVLADVLESLLELQLQIAILGAGERAIEERLRAAAARHPGRIAVWTRYDERLAHLVEAGSDFFLMPSRFEPCGLNQMYSQRYGTLPIVRRTGGLADTVENYDEKSGAGTGFVLEDLDARSLWNTCAWATSTWYDRPEHIVAMRDRAMAKDFSWNRSAAAYEDLYREAIWRRRGN
jgi:starch synthase